MILPEINYSKESLAFYKKLVRIKYWKNIMTKQEKEALVNKIGIAKLNDGMKRELMQWMADYTEFILLGGFVEEDGPSKIILDKHGNKFELTADDIFDQEDLIDSIEGSFFPPDPEERKRKIFDTLEHYRTLDQNELERIKEIEERVADTKSYEFCYKHIRGNLALDLLERCMGGEEDKNPTESDKLDELGDGVNNSEESNIEQE